MQCSQKGKPSNEVLIARNNFDWGYSQLLTFYRDSSFSFKEINHTSIPEIKIDCIGKYLIKNDTAYLSSKIVFGKGNIAIIKDGFIEFINGDYPYKFQIIKSNIPLKQSIFVDKFADYSSFVFNPDFYDFFTSNSKPYDLNLHELVQLDSLLKVCIKENSNEISKPFEIYYKICVAVITPEKEKQVRVSCACKSGFSDALYRNDKVCDGGDCYFRVIINLSNLSYHNFNVNGVA